MEMMSRKNVIKNFNRASCSVGAVAPISCLEGLFLPWRRFYQWRGKTERDGKNERANQEERRLFFIFLHKLVCFVVVNGHENDHSGGICYVDTCKSGVHSLVKLFRRARSYGERHHTASAFWLSFQYFKSNLRFQTPRRNLNEFIILVVDRVILAGFYFELLKALMYCCVGPKAKKALFSLPLLTQYNTMTQSSWSNLFRLEEKERVVKRDERYPVLGVGPDPNGSFNVENFAFGKRFLPFNKKEIKLLLTKVTSFIHDITTTSAASIIIS
ncbi:hypothetical protein T08_10448 [Trichinella sp. T8]|nr:hypothetical protein T08_10448 [Trichinella sp. T8]